ncbi:MAG: alkaline phosphatase family protein [Gemmatimonadota bacterium]|nr:alkaline phosphatase family protein [Gemmatimonadota bacterium]
MLRCRVELSILPGALLAVLLAFACRTGSERAEVIRQVDLDGDGRTDRFEIVDDGRGIDAVSAPEPGSDPPRTVVIAVDGIPREIFDELRREGRFRAFFPAAGMVAPFPSLTDVSFTRIFRTERSAGYEDKFFDREANRIRGGVEARAAGGYKRFAPFHDVFDWESPRLWGAFVYLAPERVAIAEVDRIERLLRGGREAWQALYMGSTDGLGHELGWSALAEQLRRLDRVLVRWLASGGGSRRVVLFSDHGMSDGPTKRFDLQGSLERGGFHLADTLGEARDVVAPAYGLIGSIHLYTRCGVEAEVARAVVSEAGADFAVWREGDRVVAVDASGSATPLERAPDEYPDLRSRVRRALFEPAVHNPANVIVSLEDGWHWGSSLFEPFVSMEGTHGSARRTSTVGFLASNVDRLPETVRAGEVHRWLGRELEPAEGARSHGPSVCRPPPAGRD